MRNPTLPPPCRGGLEIRGGMIRLRLRVPPAHHLGPAGRSRTQYAQDVGLGKTHHVPMMGRSGFPLSSPRC